MAGVEYRELPAWPGYLIGSDGTVLGPNGPLKQATIKKRDGSPRYYYVGLSEVVPGEGAKRSRRVTVHSLVCAAFHGPRPEGLEVRHLNSNGLDNRASNLAWGTREENLDDERIRLWETLRPLVMRAGELDRAGASIRKIAAELGVSVGTAHTYVHRSRAFLTS